ncbi:MAG TPA: hypothetical protein VIV40_09125, partial [Kofleriaceae bacterium]
MRSFTHLHAAVVAVSLTACVPQQSSPSTQPLPSSRPIEGGTTVAAKPTKPTKPTKPATSEPAKAEPKGDAMDAVAKQFIDAHNAVRAKH